MSATPRQQSLTAFFITNGYHPYGSAAMVGNFSQEVGINLPTRFTLTTDHGSQGIAQWRLDRLTKLEQFCANRKLNVTELIPQAQFVIWELDNEYPQLNAMLKTPGNRSLANLTANFSGWFERPSKQYENLDNRIKQAKMCLESVKAPVTAKPATPTPRLEDHIVVGATAIGGVASIGAVIGWGTSLSALLVTAIVAFLILWAVGYVDKRKKPPVSPVEPAVAPAIMPSMPASTNELRSALDEMKMAQQRLSAATAVYLLERKESDQLLADLKAIGERE